MSQKQLESGLNMLTDTKVSSNPTSLESKFPSIFHQNLYSKAPFPTVWWQPIQGEKMKLTKDLQSFRMFSTSWSFKPLATALRKVKAVWEAYSPSKAQRPTLPSKFVPKLNLGRKFVKPRKWIGRRSLYHVLSKDKLLNDEKAMVERLEEGFSSNTSRRSKASRRNTIVAILSKNEATKDIYPITPYKIKLLGGTLKESGYKAAHLYLGELKLMAVEQGQHWSDLLERTLKLSKLAVVRASGPKKKAPEVQVAEGTGQFFMAEDSTTDKLKVNLAKELFEFGVIWMLREVELAQLLKEHIAMNPLTKLVSLTLPVSKTDQMGKGTLRVLQCLCKNGCEPACPYKVTKNLVDGMERLKLDSPFVTKDGKKATKAQIVKDWKSLYGNGVTGHSARRTGALRYIKCQWPLAQVAYLGRWRSSVIYDYAAEALESLPVNNSFAFQSGAKETQEKNMPNVEQMTKIEEVRAHLSVEIAAMKANQEATLKALDAEVEAMKQRGQARGDRLPTYVQAKLSKIVHTNLDLPNCSPPHTWKTMCGWAYFKSDFVFVTKADGLTLCKKCLDLGP